MKIRCIDIWKVFKTVPDVWYYVTFTYVCDH